MSRTPNLFIIGAPKCGTTAWYEYLKRHAEISFSEAKEPHYFCEDFPNFRWAKSEADYLKLFQDLPPAKYTGEASVMYLFSEVAIKHIREFQPDAKIMVFLRKYENFFASYHSQIYLMHDEDRNDLDAAWELQADRASGQSLPPDCREPRFVQYRDVCSFGHQLKRVYDHFPREQVKVVIFEEWISEPVTMYQEIMDFLELENDGFDDFQKVNVKRGNRFRWLSRFIHRPPGFILAAAKMVRSVLGLKRLGMAEKIKRLNEREKKSHLTVSENLAKRIQSEMTSDRELLESLLGRQIESWN